MICWFENHSNNLQNSTSLVYLLSTKSSRGGGLYMNQQNLRKCLAMFTTRSVEKQNWVNDQDRYLFPNHEGLQTK
jgi:hypothetical protein